MNCRGTLRRLPLYSAGLIEEKACWPIEGHLAVCQACRARLGQYLAIDAAIRANHLRPDADRMLAVLARIDVEYAWQSWTHHFVRQSLAQCAGIIVLAGIAGAVAITLLATNPWSHAGNLVSHMPDLPLTRLTLPVSLPVLLLLTLLPLTAIIMWGMNRLLNRA